MVLNAVAVIAAALTSVHTLRDIDTTLRHYVVRSDPAGERDHAVSLLSRSDASSLRPTIASNRSALVGLLLRNGTNARRDGSSAFPRSAAVRDAPESTLERLHLDAVAGLSGSGGADELHVLIRGHVHGGTREEESSGGEGPGEFDDGVSGGRDVFDLDVMRSVCQLKRQIETSPGFSDVCKTKENAENGPQEAVGGIGHCAPAWSIFDIHAVYETIGLGHVLSAFVHIGRYTSEARKYGGASFIVRARLLCSHAKTDEVSGSGAMLCELGAGLGCAPEGCSRELPASARVCVLAANYVEACDWIRSAAPSDDDMRVLAAVPDAPIDGKGCGALNAADVRATLRLGAMFMRWAEVERAHRSGSSAMSVLARPWMLLVDRWFGGRPGTADLLARSTDSHLQSYVTRIIFCLKNHAKGVERQHSISPATSWTMQIAGPRIIEKWRAQSPDGTIAATATWRQVWAFKEIGKATLWDDLKWTVGSFVWTATLTLVNTGSAFLTVGGMTLVVASLPAAHFLYVYGVGVTWMGVLNFLGVFIILGIGADDIFIILDFWRQSASRELHCADDLALDGSDYLDDAIDRMHWTIRTSQYVVSMTSLTTAASFACNLASQIAPIRFFGVFMVLLIMCNYWLVCTTFPALIVMRHRSAHRVGRVSRWLTRGWRVAPITDDKDTSMVTVLGRGEKGEIEGDATAESSCPGSDRAVVEQIEEHPENAEAPLGARQIMSSCGWIVGCSGHPRRVSPSVVAMNTLANFVIRFKRFVVIVAAAGLALSILVARGLRSPESVGITLYPESHNVNRFAVASKLFAFAQVEEAVRVSFVWGVQPQAVPTTLAWDPDRPLAFSSDDTPASSRDTLAALFEDPNDYVGARGQGRTSASPAWDPSFDIVSEASQTWMTRFCDALRQSEETLGRLRRDGQQSVDCFMDKVGAYVHDLTSGRVGLPLPPSTFALVLRSYGGSTESPGNMRFLRRHHSSTGSGASPPAAASPCTSPSPCRTSQDACEEGGCEGVVAVSVIAVLRMSAVSSTAKQISAEAEFWEDWFRRQLASAPQGLRRGFQTSPAWVRVATEAELVRGAWMSTGLSLVFSFGVILGASRSLRLTVLATFSVGSVVASFVAFMVLSDWRLGIIEAVCTMVAVGLSIDYILHVAGAYVRAPSGTREERAREALRMVGISVVSGASTTVGASLFLLGCTMTFFTKFGLFIAWTLSMSLLQAAVVFPAMCAVWGPEDARASRDERGTDRAQRRGQEQGAVSLSMSSSAGVPVAGVFPPHSER